MSKSKNQNSLWSLFPKNDKRYKIDEDSSNYTGPSKELKYLIKSKFHDVRYLSSIFTDAYKRDKLRLSHRILSWFGHTDLNVKVRLPKKPNIYYVDKNWYKTGDYYIDPVEIWWSESGHNVLNDWKGTCDIQRPTINNTDILQSVKSQSQQIVITVKSEDAKNRLLEESEFIHDHFLSTDVDITLINTLAHLYTNPGLIKVEGNDDYTPKPFEDVLREKGYSKEQIEHIKSDMDKLDDDDE